jgi:hypothetical protein
LLLHKLAEGSAQQGMLAESGTPIQQISIVGTGQPFDFGMAFDSCLFMRPEGRLLIGKDPSLSLFGMPVFLGYPLPSLSRVSSSGPSSELGIENKATVLKCISGNHRFVIVGPSTYLAV